MDGELDSKRRPTSTAYSVSCAGVAFCAATAYNPGPVNAVTVWNGSTWSLAQNVPTPSRGGSLYGISCFDHDELHGRRHRRRAARR